jgi:hypothetical protein
MNLRKGTYCKNNLTGVAILKQMPGAAVPAIEADRVAGQKTLHYG